MKKRLNILTSFLLIVSILPLFFVDEIYPRVVYEVLFLYFIIYLVYEVKNNVYKDKKILLVIDIIAALSLITPYKIFFMLRLVRVFSIVFKLKGFKLIGQIVKEEKEILQVIMITAIMYIIVTSLIVFKIEPQTFDNSYFNAFYWGVISLTTVGYGDIYPVTVLGKTVAIISSLLGIAIIALPTGVITSRFLEIGQRKKEEWEE